MSKSKKREKMLVLYKKMKADETLPLKKQATKLVFGSGNVDAEALFVGEGPGYWEDQKGIPFVGNAGKFLDQLLATAGLVRDSVFITNVVHYRPPNNRDPLPEEIKAFGKYLDKIIKIIEPKIIVTLGRFSMAKFIPDVMISQVHGKPKKMIWEGIDLMIVPMYHPAAGLRNGEIKRRTVDDFQNLGEILVSMKSEKNPLVSGDEKQMELV